MILIRKSFRTIATTICVGAAIFQNAGCVKETIEGPYLKADIDTAVSGTWTPLGDFNQTIYTLQDYSGELWIGGGFTTVNSSSMGNLVTRYNGSFMTPVGVLFNGASVRKLHVDLSNKLWALGNFGSGSGHTNVAYCTGNTSGWFGSTWDMGSTIYSAMTWGSTVIAGGSFTTFNSVIYNGIAQHNGSTWNTVGNGFNGTVLSLISYNGYVTAGGNFTMSGPTPVSGIGQFISGSWQQLGGGVNGIVRDMVIFNGNLVVAGTFTSAGSTPVNNIAVWNGSSWSDPGQGIFGSVYDLEVFNGKLYAGGSFSFAGSAGANNVAVWDGSAWAQAGDGLPNPVYALEAYNSKLYAGTILSSSYNELFRLN